MLLYVPRHVWVRHIKLHKAFQMLKLIKLWLGVTFSDLPVTSQLPFQRKSLSSSMPNKIQDYYELVDSFTGSFS